MHQTYELKIDEVVLVYTHTVIFIAKTYFTMYLLSKHMYRIKLVGGN